MKPGGIMFVIFLLSLVLSLIAAFKFGAIAEEKGYSGYFWWCFLLGGIGWLMVVALPDRGRPIQVVQEAKKESQKPVKEQQPKTEDRLPEL